MTNKEKIEYYRQNIAEHVSSIEEARQSIEAHSSYIAAYTQLIKELQELEDANEQS